MPKSAYIINSLKEGEITPRLATKIADIRHNFPKNWKKLVSNQL